MKKILLLGAGLVSKPGTHYLLQQPDIELTVASRTVFKAEELVKGYKNGKARQVNVENESELAALVKENDIIISLLPWIHHLKVARLCIEFNRHMVTTSYVSEGMRNLSREAEERGLTFLNEIGVDPGIDHMSAQKIIDEIHAEGGQILHFFSYCGGLPAPEDNDNPFGYKFSWSPKGVVLASKNSAQYLENGEIVKIDSKDLFVYHQIENIEGLGKFEVYANRDSLPYREIYGIKEALTVKRGTYRNIGWCHTLKKIVDLGLVDDTEQSGIGGIPFIQMMAKLLNTTPELAKEKAAEKLGLHITSPIMQRLEWLGLFSNETTANYNNYLDILSEQLQKKLYFKPGQKDLVVLKHKFVILNKDLSKDIITSTLIDFGIPNGDSSMARTVSLPMAIGTLMIAHGQISKKGVIIPVFPEIYQPVLKELEKFGIRMNEKRFPVA